MRWVSSGGSCWLEADLGGARAAFSTRLGGVSEGRFASLNLGILTGDERGAVLENRRRLAAALALEPERIAIGRQVHGAELSVHIGPQEASPYTEPGAELPEVDGHRTAEARLALLVFAADCLPVALRGPGGVAMLHCGWRGAAAGILARGAAAVAAERAAIGPGIGQCCYEVGEEVLEAFSDLGESVARERKLDLAEAAEQLLRRAGVEQVERAGLCTSCNERLFYSHRRDGGRTGRQAGLAWIEGEG